MSRDGGALSERGNTELRNHHLPGWSDTTSRSRETRLRILLSIYSRLQTTEFYQQRSTNISVILMYCSLLLDIEVRAFPQTLNNQLLAFSTLVNVLDIICSFISMVLHISKYSELPVVVSKWLVAS